MERLNSGIIFAASQRPNVIGSEGEVVEWATSTMDVVAEKAKKGAPDGYVVATEHQSSGRGRKGGWESDPGQSVLLSVLLKTGFRARERMLIGIMGAVAAAETLQDLGCDAQIKWPNDIVINTLTGNALSLKKLGGVLVEPVSRGDVTPAHILGIGLNINQSESQLPKNAIKPPASVRTTTGKTHDRNQVCLSLLKRLDAWYKTLVFGKTETLLARWKKLSCLLDKEISVKYQKENRTGRVLGLSVRGELIFLEKSGEKHYLSDRDASLLL